MPRHIQRGGSTAAPFNVQYRLSKLSRHVPVQGVWLDCGCADGGYTAALVAKGAARAVGIDVEENRVAAARARYVGRGDVDFVVAQSENLPFAEGSFDGVFVNEVLEHVENEDQTLGEIWRVLRPGGYLAVMSPNRFFPFEGHGLRLRHNVPLNFPVPLVPWLPSRLTDRFAEARNYWPWELRTLVVRNGFAVVHSSSLLPVFEMSRWLPSRLAASYRRNIERIEALPVVRHFGVSTMVVARRAS